MFKNKWVSFFLCLFFGYLGIHKFYEGKIEELKDYLASLEDFEVTYVEVGDGIALLKQK